MTKKVFNLVTGLVTGAETISVAVVTYCEPSYSVAINAAIPIVGTAIIAVCKLFTKEE